MAELKAFEGTAAEQADMEKRVKARKDAKQANFNKMRSSKEALLASRPAPATKLVAPTGTPSGKSLKGTITSRPPAAASDSLKLMSRTGSTPAMQANGMAAKARLDAMKKMAGGK